MSDFKMWAHRISGVHEETIRLLEEAGADKEMMRQAYREHAKYLQGKITEYKELTEAALLSARQFMFLTEYLYGTEGRDAAEARQLHADTYFMAERVQEAFDHYEKLIGFLEERPEPAPDILADIEHSAGVCLMVLGRNEESLKHLLKAYPFYDRDHEKYRFTLWTLCSNIGEVYFRLGDGDKMEEFFDKGREFDDRPMPR